MKPSYFRGRIARLGILLAVAVAYIGWILIRHTLIHHARLDGSIGVLGGLYICSHPAAHFVDLLFFGHHVENRLHGWEWFVWISLNLVVFLLGCLMIIVGVTHFVK